jgi:dTDP-4-dehydrorhamnose 3,5-epimerase-like enzyme
MTITQLEFVSKDDRGYVAEYVQNRTGNHLLVYTKAGIIRGKHYHKGVSASKDPEIIILISGTCVFSWRHIESEEVLSQTVQAPARIEIPVLIWHELRAETDCALIEFNSQEEHQADTFYDY